jgi:4-hydroxybenzoate polyprenyltransferase
MSVPLKAVVLALRPKQWTKNAVVLAALVFALGDTQQHVRFSESLLVAIIAAAIFCIVSSAVYLLNDLKDVEQDRLHPVKRLRPIASGELPVAIARAMFFIFALGGLAAAWFVTRQFFLVTLAYFIVQIFYTFGLKRVALVDIFIISAGFVMRALAGAVAINVRISEWLLLCTLLLSLFLALCKRRHELVVMNDGGGETRASLRQYNEKVLDQLVAMIGGATMICYSLYTLWPETVLRFGTKKLGFTIPFVIFGIFRYVDNVYRKELGGRPEQILLTDRTLLIDIALYAATVIAIFTLR